MNRELNEKLEECRRILEAGPSHRRGSPIPRSFTIGDFLEMFLTYSGGRPYPEILGRVQELEGVEVSRSSRYSTEIREAEMSRDGELRLYVVSDLPDNEDSYAVVEKDVEHHLRGFLRSHTEWDHAFADLDFSRDVKIDVLS